MNLAILTTSRHAFTGQRMTFVTKRVAAKLAVDGVRQRLERRFLIC